MQNKVVVHFVEGKIIKGITYDFSPDKIVFHISDKETGKSDEINIHKLKAVFFVKDFFGKMLYQERKDVERKGLGK